MKLDNIVVSNKNRFLLNALKLFVKGNNINKTIIIIGDNYNEYLKVIYNIDNSIKLITNIYELKISDFDSKLIIGINNDEELNKYYNVCKKKNEYKLVSKIEEGLKLYIQD